MKNNNEVPYDEIDERMRPLIRALQEQKFATFACCEGGEGHSHNYAWIRIGLTRPGPEQILSSEYPKGMDKWYKEYERLCRFVYCDAGWLCEVKISTMFGRTGPSTGLFMFVCLDIDFSMPLSELVRQGLME